MTVNELRLSALAKRSEGRPLTAEFVHIRKDGELYNDLVSMYPWVTNANPGQLLYHLIEDVPELKCFCGKTRQFYKLDKGYAVTCGSTDCKNQSRTKNIRKTSIEKYGVEHPTQLQKTKDRSRATMLERYGSTSNFSGAQRDKIYESNLEKFGVRHPLQRKDSQEKRTRTVLEKHGSMNFIQSDKAKKTNKERYGDSVAVRSDSVKTRIRSTRNKTTLYRQSDRLKKWNIEVIKHESECSYYQVRCTKCNTDLRLCSSTLNAKLRLDVDPCTICNPYIPSYSSGLEQEVFDWIRSLGEKILNNQKGLVTGSELDIYLPERGIGFEFNGLYWHSEVYKESDYHQKKTRVFLNKGVKIYHIWEDDWINKKEIVKGRILTLLGKNQLIGARECGVHEINGKAAKWFFDQYHIDGHVNAKRYFGAYYSDELVGVMSFSKARFGNRDSWEIIRFATQSGKTVSGLADRLFKRFLKEERPLVVISYAKTDWTPDPTGSVYRKLGFQLDSQTGPGLYWVVDGIRQHRLNFTKKKLIAQGLSLLKTAQELMHEKKYYRIWDSGNWKFRMELPENR